MKKLNRIIFLSLLVSIGLALSLLETSIPLPIPIPGAKLGLSNIVILVSLIIFGFRDAFLISVLKSIVFMLVTGSVSSFMYSISGAILSIVVMWISYKYFSNIFSLIGISILGAVAHNTGQVATASLIMNNIKIFSYLSILLLMSLFTGYFVGISSKYISENLKKNFKTIVK